MRVISVFYSLNNLMEEDMKKMALVVGGLVAILLTFNLTGKIQKWLKDREAEDLASKAF